MKQKIAVIAAILENPEDLQEDFNSIVARFRHLIRGRMGLPMSNSNISALALICTGSVDEINSLTGKLGNIEGINIKTSISSTDILN